MASLSDLINVLQPLDGRDKSTLYNAARELRKEGFLPRGQRGGSAPQIDFCHAANVLLGVFCATHVKDAPSRCRLLNNLLHINSQYSDEESGYWVREERFGAALTRLLSALPAMIDEIEQLLLKGQYYEELEDLGEDLQRCARGFGPLVLRVIVRNDSACVELTDNRLRPIWREDFVSDPSVELHARKNDRRTRDRQITIEFGLWTLVETFLCVAAPEQSEILAKRLNWDRTGE